MVPIFFNAMPLFLFCHKPSLLSHQNLRMFLSLAKVPIRMMKRDVLYIVVSVLACLSRGDVINFMKKESVLGEILECALCFTDDGGHLKSPFPLLLMSMEGLHRV